MRTGLFYLFESLGQKPVAQVYRDTEEECLFAEEVGFTGVHPAEHHFSDDYGIMPRVEIFLAKLAGRTRKMRLFPMVTVAPLTDAVRLAEDSALLDHLCDGRYTLSVGSGYRRYEFDAFGLNLDENRERTREALECVRSALTKDKFSFEGKHYKYKDVHVVPRPRQAELPIFLTTSSTSQVEWAAQQGFGVLPAAGFSWPLIKNDRDLYVKAAKEAGKDPGKFDAPIFKWIYVAETDAEAKRVAQTAFMATFMAFFVGGERLIKNFMARFPENTQMMAARDPSKMFELLTSEECMICCYGSPETVRQKLQPLKSCGVDYFIGGFQVGALPTAEIRKSMKLYADKVMPHL